MHGEITQLALKYLADFAASPVPHAVFLIEDETKDEAQLFKGYYEANRAWDNLLALDLVKDGRQPGMWIDTLEEKTGRQFRMFILTETGKMMIDPRASAWIN